MPQDDGIDTGSFMATKTTFEEEIANKGYLLYNTVGNSMEPLLHNHASVVKIEKCDGVLNVYDVPLFKRPATGAYVLHRIVKVRAHDYLIIGDNQTVIEVVPHEWVIGVMTAYGGAGVNGLISVDDEAYKQYVSSRMKGFWTQYYGRKIKAFPGRVVRKLKRMSGGK